MDELARIIQKFKMNITILQDEIVLLQTGYPQVAHEEVRIMEVQALHQNIAHQLLITSLVGRAVLLRDLIDQIAIIVLHIPEKAAEQVEVHLLAHSLLQVEIATQVEAALGHQVTPLEVADPAVRDLHDLQAHHLDLEGNW